MIQGALAVLEKGSHWIWTCNEVEIEETNSKVLGKGKENQYWLIEKTQPFYMILYLAYGYYIWSFLKSNKLNDNSAGFRFRIFLYIPDQNMWHKL